ncbi:MAG TPA: hypothetical protein VKY85_29100, partial [Candidatus Angelobacter sp.]|nr:hypothetical protein [Candidatus Angelobacter sp.]
YTYDNAGNRTAKTNQLNSVAEQYAYDAIYQLQQVTQGTTTTESYTYVGIITVCAASFGVGCLVTGAVLGVTALGGAGLAGEGAYYGLNQNFYNPFK